MSETVLLETPTVRIGPSALKRGFGLREIWASRELIYFLTRRDIALRYKQTIIGVAWVLLQPLMNVLIFTLIFGRLAGIRASEELPYPLFCFAGLVPWMFFSAGVTTSSNSLVGNANLITKIYFPRLAIPISSVCGGLMDLAVGLFALVCMAAWFDRPPTIRYVALPFFILLEIAATLGIGLLTSSLNVRYRDVRHIVPFLIQFWMFASPVVYPTERVPEAWRILYALNPMVGVIDGVRWSMLGTGEFPFLSVSFSTITTCGLLLGGAYCFRRMEKTFADLV